MNIYNTSGYTNTNTGGYITTNNTSYTYTNSATYKRTYIVLGTEIELNSDTSLGIAIALINTLGFEIYDNIKDQCELPLELKELMEEKRIPYNRERNIDIVLK